MEKHFCDVCGVETSPHRRRTVIEMEQILDGSGLMDVCSSCLEKAKQITWSNVIRAAILEEGRNH